MADLPARFAETFLADVFFVTALFEAPVAPACFAFDFGFAVDWMRKDLSICLGEARKNGAHLPVTALVDQFYSEVQKMGGKRWDTSSLIARLDR